MALGGAWWAAVALAAALAVSPGEVAAVAVAVLSKPP